MDYSDKIQIQRKKMKISQKELANMLGVSNRAVSKWENGITNPTIENYRKLSAIFQVPLEYFFSENNAAKTEKSIKTEGMQSLKELYKIGFGPSSSHTMGPEKACKYFLKRAADADFYEVTLYGSLAKTGKGHGTDRIIKKCLGADRVKVNFDYLLSDIPHPNTMNLAAFKNGKKFDEIRVMSIGGGNIEIEGEAKYVPPVIYPHKSFSEISEYCRKNNISLYDYILKFEDKNILSYLEEIWNAMKQSIAAGLEADSTLLPGGLGIKRKAKYLFRQHHIDESAETAENRIVCSYAYAVSEENACGNRIVTAPTCGSAGVVPAVLYYYQRKRGFSDCDIVKALAVGGIVGNLVKTNASISGAEHGCQAEVGTACAMAAAMLAELCSLSIEQIEYAAEIAIEHHLGLTCDPVCGLVQIPCIERNAVAAMRAINAVSLANFLSDTRKISLDYVIETMRETGRDLSAKYRETGEGGLAKVWFDDK